MVSTFTHIALGSILFGGVLTSITNIATGDETAIVATAVQDIFSIRAGGRNIMRTAEGALISSFVKTEDDTTGLFFSSSTDGGKTWYTNVASNVGTSNALLHPAVDSNFNGAYIAYVEKVGNKHFGRVIYSPNPLARQKNFLTSTTALTPELAEVGGTFIAASRVGWGDKPNPIANSVVYGWTDLSTGDIYVGVSPDGRVLPRTQLILRDARVTSSPAVAIFGEYVFLTFLTTDPAFAPTDLPREARGGGHYPAWIESRDLGKTWSKPTPLFGRSIKDFPKLTAAESKDAGALVSGTVFAAGGSPGWQTSALVWLTSAARQGDQIIFVVSALSPITVEGPFERGAFDDPNNLIGIVSFRRSAPNSKWTHVPSNLALIRTPTAGGIESLHERLDAFGASFGAPNAKGSQHQYSALVDTPIRATTYLETAEGDDNSDAALVIVASVDTGKVFDRYAYFNQYRLQKLGVKDFHGGVAIDVSQCLFEDRDGEVYVDLLIHDTRHSNDIQYVKLPLGINARAIARESSVSE